MNVPQTKIHGSIWGWLGARGALALVVAGTLMGPGALLTLDRATAEVYEEGQPDLSREVVLLDPAAVPTGPVRRAVVNGSPVRFQVAETRRSIQELFDVLEARYAEPGAAAGWSPPAGDRSGFDPELDRILRRGGFRSLSLEDGDEGVFGALGGPRMSDPAWPFQVLKQLRSVAVTGTLDALEQPVAAVAYRQPDRDVTTFVQAVPQQGFRWDALLPAGDRDMPGRDPAWLTRPSGSVRLVAFEEVGPLTGYGLHVYGVPTAPRGLVAELEAAGLRGDWSADGERRWVAMRDAGASPPASIVVTAGRRRFASVMVVIEAEAL